MKCVSLFIVALFAANCSSGSATSSGASNAVPTKTVVASTQSPTPPPHPKNGDYPAKGKVTKINNELGSVEVDHEDVPGLMPPMIMEFYVDDKSALKQIAVGDNVDFTIKYKDGQETISKIAKSK
jgi:Cu/Ag efflux protein CusF